MSPILVAQIVLVVVVAAGWYAGRLVHAVLDRRNEDGQTSRSLPRMSDTIAFISGAVGILLGLLLSFSVSNYQDAQASVKSYGSSAAAAYRATESFDDPGRLEVRQDLYCAVNSFVKDDWANGTALSPVGSEQANLWMTKLNQDVNALDLGTITQQQVFPLLMQATLDMSEWRQMILLTSVETIPAVIWIVIYVSVFLLALLLKLHLADRRGLGILSFGVAYVALAVIIYALTVLDYPLHNFGTGAAISAESLHEMLTANNFDLAGQLDLECQTLRVVDLIQ